MPEFLDSALKYAEQGFAVFPLKPRTKKPATEHGFKDATSDPAQIYAWWAKNPDYNIGVRTGGGLVVIDVDDKPEEGKYGSQDLLDWERNHGDFQPTWTVLTGTGGLHYWYRTDKTFTNAVEMLGSIDVRSDGGYVVAPPSVHPNGNLYEWEASGDPDDVDIADLSGSALELLDTYAAKKKRKKKKSVPYKEVKQIDKGERQKILLSLEGSLLNMNLTADAIEAAVRAENDAKCKPPLSEEELQEQIFPFLKRDITPEGDYAETVLPSETLDDGITEDELIMPTLDLVEVETAEWLEYGYIPKKNITIMCGTGGVGKTTVWCAIASAISRGESSLLTAGSVSLGAWRDNRKVMFFSAEDSVGVVLKSKMQRSGAVQKNIYFFDVTDKRFQGVKFSSTYLEKLIKQIRPALVIFDPIQAFIDKKVKMSDRNAMRQELEPLIRLGQEYDTTFMLIMHSNKMSNVWGRQRMADSADLWDIARSVLMVGDTGTEGYGYISQEKNSYAKQSETVIFKITDGIATYNSTSKKKDKDFVLEATKNRTFENSNDISDACNFILSTIAETSEKRMLVTDLDEQLRAFGYSNYAIRCAKKNLKDSKLLFYKKDGYEGKNYLCTSERRQV